MRPSGPLVANEAEPYSLPAESGFERPGAKDDRTLEGGHPSSPGQCPVPGKDQKPQPATFAAAQCQDPTNWVEPGSDNPPPQSGTIPQMRLSQHGIDVPSPLSFSSTIVGS